MDLKTTLLTLGVILILVGLIGQVKAKEIEVGTKNPLARLVLGLIGFAFVGVALSDSIIPYIFPPTSTPIFTRTVPTETILFSPIPATEIPKTSSSTPITPNDTPTSTPTDTPTSQPKIKIGYNPKDRFMMTLGNTLVVVTQDGDVFGSEAVGQQLQPVFQFSGAKIGYSPQDRFMMTLGNTLVVVTQDGDVFGSEVVGHQLQPVFQFSGVKIGYNPIDRFMMTLGNTLVVVTQDGDVFGSEAVGQQLQPVFQFK